MTTTHGVSVRLYDTANPALGRHQVLDARSLKWLYCGSPAQARPVHWQPRVAVLDQQNLFQQGISVSRLMGDVVDVDALGSCTANAATAALSAQLTPEQCATAGLDLDDPVQAETWAIQLYAEATRQDEWLARQWPADDCGSSGLGVARAARARGLVDSYVHARTANGLVDLLQHGPVLLGLPWYNAWFDVPSNGNVADCRDWKRSGVAGGHEVCATGIERVTYDRLGRLDLGRTVLRVRNSWGAAWGLDGDFMLPLDIYAELRREIDAIQLRPAAAA
ncbi:hypothetical protein ACIF6L_34680 [Kitasatospora sp. NPDC086009]|uniref:hypothetical protein n=1 Tax=unclassified Kitasatospora TaxID=2633591 RepID=UPI0037CA7627